MKIDLPPLLVRNLVMEYIEQALPGERQRLALKVFTRHEDFDPMPVLKLVAKRVEVQHCLPDGYVKKEL